MISKNPDHEQKTNSIHKLLGNDEYKELKYIEKLAKKRNKTGIQIDPKSINPYNLNFFNIWIKFPKKMFFIFVSAILYNVGVATFLAKAATVATGVSALVQSITYTITVTAPYFAYIYLAFNLPLIIIFWKKNSRLFMLLTTYWLLWQVVFQSFLLIPSIRDFFDKISIYYINWYSPKSGYGNSLKALISWDVYGNYAVKYQELFNKFNNLPPIVFKNHATYSISEIQSIIQAYANKTSWNLLSLEDVTNLWEEMKSTKYSLGNLGEYTILEIAQLSKFKLELANGFNNPTWPIIVFTVIGGIAAGSAGGIAWKNSASTAGSDFIVYYVSKMKQKSIGQISTIVALCFAGFSILLISALEIAGILSNGKPINYGALLLRAICTIGYIFLYNSLLEIIYPKYKKIKIEIYTKRADDVIRHFKEINYWHAYNIDHLTAGYTNTETVKIETFALYLEQNMIRYEVLKADPDAWITVTKIHNIFGGLDTSKIEI
ncbi:YitT family protein [Metamycoplasma equirhinis]|uniref:YitT family protein n=1 Tax=Metamycoplasma equirhinis TaxID=92402 RepID=UPI0035937088